MKYLKLAADTKIDELISVAYRTKGRTSAAVRESAAKALLAANPQLAKSRTAGKDVVLVVPDVPGLLPSADAAEPQRFSYTGLDDVQRGVKQLLKQLREAAAENLDTHKQALELLKSKEGKSALANFDEQAAALVKRAAAAEESQLKQSSADLDRTQKRLQRMLADLGELEKRFGHL